MELRAKGCKEYLIRHGHIVTNALVVSREDWATLPINAGPGWQEACKSLPWEDHVLIGIPCSLFETSWNAYAANAIVMATCEDAEKAVDAECKEAHATMTVAAMPTYVEIRTRDLEWLMKYGAAKQWDASRIRDMQMTINTLRTNLL